jgi:pimeloyl-ACP methyl ester carboxylesterase
MPRVSFCAELHPKAERNQEFRGTRITDQDGARTLRLADGRTLAWQAFGDPRGLPLYFFHGFPSCRLLAALVHEAAATSGIAIIAPDRPGFGQSTPQGGRSIADWVDDVRQLAEHLAHRRFGVLGVSCGGPYALACAQAIPDRLTYVGLMAGIGPMDDRRIRAQQARPLRVLFGMARAHPLLTTPLLLSDAWLIRANPQMALAAVSRLLSAPDRSLLARSQDVRARFVASAVEAYRQGIGAARWEAKLIARLDSRMLRAVDLPVHVYQGGLDRHVPPVMGSHMAQGLPAGRLHLYPEEGHLSILVNRFSECAVHFHDQSTRPATRRVTNGDKS